MTRLKKQTLITFASFTCIIHCIITPLLMVLFPFLGKQSHNHELEILLLLASIGCGTYIVSNGYCKHKKAHSLFLFSLGSFLWISHLFIDSIFAFNAEFILLSLGSTCVIISYIINHKFLKCCPHDCCSTR